MGNDDMRRILITTWGSPFGWSRVRYHYEGSERESYDTLPLLKDVLDPHDTIVIVLDTLANWRGSDGEPPIEEKNFSNYSEVKEDIENRINYFIENKLEMNPREIKLIIAPGVGNFSNLRVSGNMMDYYYFVTYELARLLPNEDMEVYLDLTHGMNFMPVLTYRALSSLLSLASYVRSVRLKVLNSEPYQSEVEKLIVWEVENREVKPEITLTNIVTKDERYRKASAFLSSIANGFPLALLTFCPTQQDVRNKIEEKLKEFNSKIKVEGTKIERKSKLDQDFEVLSKTYYLLRVLNSIKELRELFRTWREYQEVELRGLREISEIIFGRLPRIGIIVRREIEELERRLFTRSGVPINDLSNRWRLLCDLPTFPEVGDGECIGEDREITEGDVRNFIAHSGFEHRVTQARRASHGRVKLKYRNTRRVMELSIRAITYPLYL